MPRLRAKTPEDAFLQAIVESPEDDTPRLMYADWLTERGDVRGDFIRVQCELARLEPDHPGYDRLREQEQELLEAHSGRWRSQWLGPIAARATVLFVRGMPDGVGLEEGTENDDLLHLQRIPTLRGLGLYSSAISDEGLIHLKGLKNLLVLSIEHSGVTDAGLRQLRALPRLMILIDPEPRLSEEAKAGFRRSRERRFHRLPESERRAAAVELVMVNTFRGDLSAQRPIREVSIRQSDLSDEEMLFFTALHELESMELYQVPITNVGLRHLAQLCRLRFLSLIDTRISRLAALANLTRLEDLRLWGLPSLDFDDAAPLRHLTSLRNLCLWRCHLQDVATTHLSGLKRLESLDLGTTELDLGGVGDQGLQPLCALTELKQLNLEGNSRVTDAGLAHLSGLTKLVELNLDATSVTNAGLVHLQVMKDLRNLSVERTQVTASGARALARVLPNLVIAVKNWKVKGAEARAAVKRARRR
jgi:internalin A